MARVGWHFPLSPRRGGEGQQLHPALTHRWERCRQGRAGSDHAEPPLGLQPAVAVLVGHAGGKAQPAGGRAGAPFRAPLLAGVSQQWGHCPGGCKKGHDGGKGGWSRCCAFPCGAAGTALLGRETCEVSPADVPQPGGKGPSPETCVGIPSLELPCILPALASRRTCWSWASQIHSGQHFPGISTRRG